MIFFFSAVSKLSTFEASTSRSLFALTAQLVNNTVSLKRCSILDNQLQRLLHSTSRRWPLGANQLSRPKSGLN